MSLEIKTSTLEPVRHTYANIARRFGDKPATRYQEATYDAQGTANSHYRPLWNPDKTLNDENYTIIQMTAEQMVFNDEEEDKWRYGTEATLISNNRSESSH